MSAFVCIQSRDTEALQSNCFLNLIMRIHITQTCRTRPHCVSEWPSFRFARAELTSLSDLHQKLSDTMSDADSAGSHDRASKAPRSAGGRVTRIRKQLRRLVRFLRLRHLSAVFSAGRLVLS